jgi:hypothetical protein
LADAAGPTCFGPLQSINSKLLPFRQLLCPIKGNLPLLDEKSFLDQLDMADEDEDE